VSAAAVSVVVSVAAGVVVAVDVDVVVDVDVAVCLHFLSSQRVTCQTSHCDRLLDDDDYKKMSHHMKA
jgi:hypothetical protein